jgi:flagella basal body P-ring formation protein FlgA
MASADLLASLAGKEARRLIPKGAALREVDFRAPLLVERNAPVVMEYAKGVLVMTTEGRALSNGSKGDVVKVINARSKTIVLARVVARGKVVVQ